MTELVCELIISLDGFARGQRSPAYYGYFGPDFADWIKTNTAVPQRWGAVPCCAALGALQLQLRMREDYI